MKIKNKIIRILIFFLVSNKALLAQIYNEINIYPMNVNYWTGTCDSSAKTQISLANGHNQEVGWMVFDTSPFTNNAQIVEVEFHGYLYMNNWPYWSITPMGEINPVTASASEIYNQVSTHYEQGVAYSFNQEAGTLTNGWLSRALENGAAYDLESSLLLRDYFALGIVDFDFSSSFYVGFQGWAEANKPFLHIKYDYLLCYPVFPSNLTAQVIYNPAPQVQLNWQDNSSNENGFWIYRKYGYPNDPGNYELIGTVQQDTTQFLDDLVTPDSTYTYIVFAFNECGPSIESNKATITISIPVGFEIISDEIPKEFALHQNYPNPFNPSTKIKYTIPASSLNPFSKGEVTFVTLKVYDILGNEVATLVNEEQAPGVYEIEFNIHSDEGQNLPSGIYFYQLRAKGPEINSGQGIIETKKMLLLK